MLLQHLRQNDEFVVNTLSRLALFHTVSREVEKVLTFNVVDMGLRTKGFEGSEDGPISAVGSQGAMIAYVVQIIVESRRQRRSLWCWLGLG